MKAVCLIIKMAASRFSKAPNVSWDYIIGDNRLDKFLSEPPKNGLNECRLGLHLFGRRGRVVRVHPSPTRDRFNELFLVGL